MRQSNNTSNNVKFKLKLMLRYAVIIRIQFVSIRYNLQLTRE